MCKYFSADNTRNYADVLDLIVDQYNNAIHSSIKMTNKKQVVRKTKIKDGEIYIQNWVVRA